MLRLDPVIVTFVKDTDDRRAYFNQLSTGMWYCGVQYTSKTRFFPTQHSHIHVFSTRGQELDLLSLDKFLQ